MDKLYCAPQEKESARGNQLPMTPMRKDELKKEVEKYKKLIDDIPDPNFGRIRELKEAIKKGTFLTKEAIIESAERIAARFLGKE